LRRLSSGIKNPYVRFIANPKKMWQLLWDFFYCHFIANSSSRLGQQNPGLPDGLFANQKFQFGYILDGLGVDNVGIIYGHLEYLKAIWYILLSMGVCCCQLVYFVVIWYIFPYWYVVWK
jgi:hypothetical protein